MLDHVGMTTSGNPVGAAAAAANWVSGAGDRDQAQEVLAILEDKRLLFGERHLEDELHCLHSSIEIRRELTSVKRTVGTGRSLGQSIDAIRAACRRFADAAGADARNFHPNDYQGVERFWVALGELRALVGQQVGLVASAFGLPLSPDLELIVPTTSDSSADND